MEMSSHEEDIPIPLNSSTPYVSGGHGHHGHGHVIESDMIHHHHHHPPPSAPPQSGHIIISSSSNNNNNGPSSIDHHDPTHNQNQNASFNNNNNNNNNNNKKKIVKYKECLKNHAASMGGNAIDGCGEFIPNGEEGSIDALTCSACNCHRNFHRKEIEGEYLPNYIDINSYNRVIRSKKLILTHPHNTNTNTNANLYLPPPPPLHEHHQPLLGYPTAAIPPPPLPPARAIMSYNNMGSILSESDEHDQDNIGSGGIVMARPNSSSQVVLMKKRFRTKFTQEQKEKMMEFAEKVGWKLQKQEESVVQSFCQEIGVKRRVLKVWMHNNKHNLAKKNLMSTTTSTTT